MISNKLIVILLISASLAWVHASVPGGLLDEQPADDHVRGIIKQAMSKIQESYPGGFKSIEPVSYRTQVVSGKNYFIKVKVTDNSGKIQHAHLRLYRPFNNDIEVHAIKTDVNEQSPLKYFQN